MKNEQMENLKNRTLYLYVGLAMLQLVFMFYQSGKQSMWLDEMSLLGTITKDKSVADILWQYLSVDVTNLPFFPLVAALWYRILPANDRLMLLLPGIFTAGALVFTALLAGKNFGPRRGILSAILMFISQRAVLNCGFEFRAYAFMLFFSSLTLYLFFEKNKHPGKRNLLLFGISMTLLVYTHYSGAILAAVLFISDFFRIIHRKKLYFILPYIGTGILFLPWFVLMLINKGKSISSFWTSPPTIPEIARTYKYLLSENEAIFIVFLLGVLITLYRIIMMLIRKEKPGRVLWISFEMALITICMIAPVFVYSAFINPAGGFYLKRYFLVLLPLVIAFTSHGFCEIMDFMTEGKAAYRQKEIFFVTAFFILIYFGAVNLAEIRKSSGSSWETFREAAAFVREQGILNDEGNAALVCSVNPRASLGFSEYYVRKGGKERALNTVSLQGEDPVKEMTKYDRLYLVYVHRDLSDLDPDIQKTLDQDYKLINNNEEVKAAVYERR